MPNPVIYQSLREIVTGLDGMSDDCKGYERVMLGKLLVSLVRKFGAQIISELVKDEVLRKRIKNISKMEVRKEKAKKEEARDDEDEEEFGFKKKPKS